ncbi:rCG37239 [Rattus norvegicus]|uniref:RCG37239 n=1 Tax=Rattus norvegicus TaxID=10116 RepID=A6KHY2_RAT|nr:rCG37239 [Rattus norvegicus]
MSYKKGTRVSVDSRSNSRRSSF